MIAFLNIGGVEVFILLVIGVVLYGRNLPEVGRNLGRTVANLRRSLNEFKRQIDADDSIREIRDAVTKTRDDVRKVTRVPSAISNPGRALRGLANEAMAPLPDETASTRPEGARDGDDPAAPQDGDAALLDRAASAAAATATDDGDAAGSPTEPAEPEPEPAAGDRSDRPHRAGPSDGGGRSGDAAEPGGAADADIGRNG